MTLSRDVSKLAGEKLKNIRESKKIDQMTVAKKTGYSQAVISRLENGEATLSIVHIYKILWALQKHPALFWNEFNRDFF